MSTECNQFVFGFHPQKRREIRAQFDGGAITSDGGGLLLREVEKRIGILQQFSACFTDYRNPDLIEHPVKQLVAQRVYGLALGYEDLNDHEELRNDPLLAVLVEKSDPGSQVLAGKSTLNRLELTKETASRKERYNACSPRKNEGLRREISGVLAGFAAVLQFFARVYTHLHVGQDVWQADIQGLQQITTGRIRRGDAQATATVFAFHFR